MNKYTAIIQKELRYIIPLTIITILIYAALNYSMDIYQINNHSYIQDQTQRFITLDDSPHSGYRFKNNTLTSGILENLGIPAIYLIFCFSSLAVIIAFIQFWLPSFYGNWKFTLHKPVGRSTIIIIYLSISIMTLFLTNGLCWTLLCNYIDTKTLIPVDNYIFLIGWKYGLIPLICYTTISLVGLTQKVSHIAKIPIILAFLITLLLLTYFDNRSFLIILIFLTMALPLTVYKFITNEY